MTVSLYFVDKGYTRGSRDLSSAAPMAFIGSGGTVYAYGREHVFRPRYVYINIYLVLHAITIVMHPSVIM